MRKLLAILAVTATATLLAAKVVAPSWTTTSVTGSVKSTTAAANELAQFTIDNKGWPVAVLTAAFAAPTNWTGKTLTVPVYAEGSGGITYRCGNNNICGGQQGGRLYFTTSPYVYNPQGPEDDYWFCINPLGVWVADNNTSATLTASLNPADWTNSLGHSGTDRPAGFAAAVANVRQYGLAFGGGYFFDLGLIATNGTATFHLVNFTVQ